MTDDQKAFKSHIVKAYYSMENVCFDALLITGVHYTHVRDGEIIIEKRLNQCEDDLKRTCNSHLKFIKYTKILFENDKANDRSMTNLIAKALIGVIREYVDVVYKQQRGRTDGFVYGPDSCFLRYPHLDAEKNTFNSITSELDNFKSLIEKMNFEDTSLADISLGKIPILGLEEIMYEQKYSRVIRSLKQFGLQF